MKTKRDLPAYVRESIRRILTTAAHLWWVGSMCERGEPVDQPKWVTWLYSRDLGYPIDGGKRIKITIELDESDEVDRYTPNV